MDRPDPGPETRRRWAEVDAYLTDTLVHEDAALAQARERARRVGVPAIEVSPTLGAFLNLLVRAGGARRVLEIGTLFGYSTIWLARAVGPEGRVVSLELDPDHAALARRNLAHAGVGERVDVLVGPASSWLESLVADGVEPFDLIFIDADKPNNPRYLAAALRLARPGTVIVGDNVVRDGRVDDPDCDDPGVVGTRRFLADLGADDRLDATALQVVGGKGWDGFSVAVVR